MLVVLPVVGTKGVAKAMKSIASGPKRDVGNKWFTQLSDKCKFQLFFYINSILGNLC